MGTFTKLGIISLIVVIVTFMGCGTGEVNPMFANNPQQVTTTTTTTGNTPGSVVDVEEGIIKGRLVDSPVEGVKYMCGDVMGFTDENGVFKCKELPIRFMVGNLLLGIVRVLPKDGIVTPQDLVGVDREDINASEVSNVAILLQSLDNDGVVEDVITVDDEITNNLNKELDIRELKENELKELLEDAGVRVVIPKHTALEHLKKNMLKIRERENNPQHSSVVKDSDFIDDEVESDGVEDNHGSESQKNDDSSDDGEHSQTTKHKNNGSKIGSSNGNEQKTGNSNIDEKSKAGSSNGNEQKTGNSNIDEKSKAGSSNGNEPKTGNSNTDEKSETGSSNGNEHKTSNSNIDEKSKAGSSNGNEQKTGNSNINEKSETGSSNGNEQKTGNSNINEKSETGSSNGNEQKTGNSNINEKLETGSSNGNEQKTGNSNINEKSETGSSNGNEQKTGNSNINEKSETGSSNGNEQKTGNSNINEKSETGSSNGNEQKTGNSNINEKSETGSSNDSEPEAGDLDAIELNSSKDSKKYEKGTSINQNKEFVIDLEKGVLKDTIREIVWQNSEVKYGTKEEAIEFCKSLSIAGLKWRLPTYEESERLHKYIYEYINEYGVDLEQEFNTSEVEIIENGYIRTFKKSQSHSEEPGNIVDDYQGKATIRCVSDGIPINVEKNDTKSDIAEDNDSTDSNGNGTGDNGGTGSNGTEDNGGTGSNGTEDNGGTGSNGTGDNGGTGSNGTEDNGGTGSNGTGDNGGTGSNGTGDNGGTGSNGTGDNGGTGLNGTGDNGGTGSNGTGDNGGTGSNGTGDNGGTGSNGTGDNGGTGSNGTGDNGGTGSNGTGNNGGTGDNGNGTSEDQVEKFIIDTVKGMATDKETNLVWQNVNIGHGLRENGIAFCNSLSLAGRKWRMPTSEESKRFHKYMNEQGVVPNQSFSRCKADVTADGYVRTKYGSDLLGGKPGDNINFRGVADYRCVSDTSNASETGDNGNNGDDGGTGDTGDNGNGTSEDQVEKFIIDTVKGMATDKETNLVWQNVNIGHGLRENGIAFCNSLSLAGRKWRMPTSEESKRFHKYMNEQGVVPNQSFSRCKADVTADGYVRTKYGSDLLGGKPGDNINFRGVADYRCVSDTSNASETGDNGNNGDDGGTGDTGDNGNGTSEDQVEKFIIDTVKGMATDKETNLVWQNVNIGHGLRENGIAFCNSLSLAGRKWRMPTSEESKRFHKYMNEQGVVPNQSFSRCKADVTADGYVRTKYGSDLLGGKPGDNINFRGVADYRCVSDTSNASETGDNGNNGDSGTGDTGDNGNNGDGGTGDAGGNGNSGDGGTGDTGDNGNNGDGGTGDTGDNGNSGDGGTGDAGDNGNSGDGGTGDTGDNGNNGDGGTGDTGDNGNSGDGGTGDAGGNGNSGDGGTGDAGDNGNSGDGGTGDTGDNGNSGDGGTGDTGDNGNNDDGGTGDTGDNGNSGDGGTGDAGGNGNSGDGGTGDTGDNGNSGDGGTGDAGGNGNSGDGGTGDAGDNGNSGDNGNGTSEGQGEKFIIDSEKGIVTDKETNFVWQNINIGHELREGGITLCKSLSLAGLKWRMPTSEESKRFHKYMNEQGVVPKQSFSECRAEVTKDGYVKTLFGARIYGEPGDSINFMGMADVRCVSGGNYDSTEENNENDKFIIDPTGKFATEKETNLLWQNIDIGHGLRSQGTAYCNSLSIKGRKWRMPTSEESSRFHKYMNEQGVVPQQSFGGCMADVTSDGYIRTKMGALVHGGEPGDSINFSGVADYRCVSDQ